MPLKQKPPRHFESREQLAWRLGYRTGLQASHEKHMREIKFLTVMYNEIISRTQKKLKQKEEHYGNIRTAASSTFKR